MALRRRLNTPILGIYSLCQLLAAPLWGRLSDRYGRRPILLSSMLGACGSYLILAFAHSLAALFLSRALAGFMAGNLAAAMAYASDISTPSDRAKTMGMVGAAIGIGFMLGPAIGGASRESICESANFLRPALLSAALSLVAMMLVLFMLPESHRRGRARGSDSAPAPAPRVPVWQLLRALPGLRLLALATLLVTFSQSTLESIFAIWAMDRYHFGPRNRRPDACSCSPSLRLQRRAGWCASSRRASASTDWRSPGSSLWCSAWLRSRSRVTLAWSSSGFVLCGLGAGLFNPSGAALASHQAASYNRGAIMGVYQSGTSTARVIAPFVSGTVYTATRSECAVPARLPGDAAGGLVRVGAAGGYRLQNPSAREHRTGR